MKQTVASNTTAFVTAASLMQLRVQWPVVQVVLHLATNHLDFLFTYLGTLAIRLTEVPGPTKDLRVSVDTSNGS